MDIHADRGNAGSHRTLVGVVSAGLLFAACGTADGARDETGAEPDPVTQPVSTPADNNDTDTTQDLTDETEAGSEGDTETEVVPAGAESEDTGTESGSDQTGSFDDQELPGEQVDLYPYEGDELTVVGVAAGETTGIYELPAGDGEALVVVHALSDGVVATGHNRSVDHTFWSEVTYQDHQGWIQATDTAQAGPVTDITGEVEPVEGSTREEVAEEVAAQRASDEGPSTIVVADYPSTEEVVVDVLGMGDDSVLGERLHIWVTGDEGDYQVATVESTLLCIRGVNDGICL